MCKEENGEGKGGESRAAKAWVGLLILAEEEEDREGGDR